MSDEKMLREAIDAISKKQRARAKDLLTRLLRADQSNPEYWVWMSSVVDSQNERVYCLESALRLDANNAAAKRGLVMLGVREPETGMLFARPMRRKWEVTAPKEEKEEKPKGFKGFWAKASIRNLSMGLGSLLLIGVVILLIVVIPKLGKRQAVGGLTITPDINLQTYIVRTATPVNTPTLVVRSPTPTFIGPTPLWMFLEATYTPAPPYINTPHPVIDDYRMAMRAYSRQDYQGMLTYMTYAARLDPQAADLRYYIGEAHRLLGDNQKALENFQQAIELNAYFAPAWLGIAQVRWALDPEADIEDALEKAIELDPGYTEGFLVRASYYISKGETEKALEDLATAEQLAPNSAILFVERARLYMAEGKFDQALQDALRAHEIDFTLLPAYHVLAQAYMALDQPEEALQFAQVYVRYETKDPQAWLLLGKAYLTGKNYEKALDAFDNALELQERLADAYYYRGLVYLELRDGKNAVIDLADAQRFKADSFEINLAMGRALALAERYEEAYRQLKSIDAQAQTDEQRAQLYYWRAIVAESYAYTTGAIQNWESLLALPEGSVSEEWLAEAQEHLDKLYAYTATPTVTTTATFTPVPSFTPTPSVTPTPSFTPTPSLTPTPSPTLTPSSTPTPTVETIPTYTPGPATKTPTPKP